MTPPGELPWTFACGKAGNAPTAGDGMLLSASRPTLVQGSANQTVPDTVTGYDPATGDIATVTGGGQTVTHAYDTLGRQISYADGAGNTTTTAYDALGRPVRTADSAPFTTPYTYDSAKDPRGLETSRTDSAAGTLTAAYDADARLAVQTLPGGYTLTVTTTRPVRRSRGPTPATATAPR